tara:strand:- start:2946 stop:3056 length:111 start_codon:yes stop_codon:yes gene_type:complete
LAEEEEAVMPLTSPSSVREMENEEGGDDDDDDDDDD